MRVRAFLDSGPAFSNGEIIRIPRITIDVPVVFEGIIPELPQIIKYEERYYILETSAPVTYTECSSFRDCSGQIRLGE